MIIAILIDFAIIIIIIIFCVVVLLLLSPVLCCAGDGGDRCTIDYILLTGLLDGVGVEQILTGACENRRRAQKEY